MNTLHDARTQPPIQHATMRASRTTLARPRLFALLDDLSPVTLVAAPAGYGKSVLISSWLETTALPSAWLTLDASHNHPAHFAAALLTALTPVLPRAGSAAQALAASSAAATPLSLAGFLLEALSALEQSTILVLDNYHAIESGDVHTIVGQVLRRQLRTLRLVLGTRHDPPLSLVTLRAHGQLTEVRTNALRFTQSEIAALLHHRLGVSVDDSTVAQIEASSEGWITGLNLMALSVRGQPDIPDALRQLSAGSAHTLDYLTLEVLERQPPALHEFLLQCSILDRLNSSLCAAVIGDAQTARESLRLASENNLFLYAAEAEPEWLRFQRLFQQQLQEQLRKRLTMAEIAQLHARASAWYAAAGMLDDALRHAVAAEEVEGAVQLVAQHRHALMDREAWRTLQRWLSFFDRDAIERHPDLLLAEVWLLLNLGRIADFPARLERVDRLLAEAESATAAGASTQDAESKEARRRLRAEADVLRSEHLYLTQHPREAIALATATLAQAPPSHVVRSFLLFSLAGAQQMRGAQNEADALLADALTWPQGYPSPFHVRILAAQCQLQWIAADLPAMLRAARQMQAHCKHLPLPEMCGWAAYYAGSVHYQWDDLAQAEATLSTLVHQPAAISSATYANASCALALTWQAQGRTAEAQALCNAAIDFVRTANPAYLPLLKAFAAELALRQGDASAAAQWVVQQAAPFPQAPVFSFFAPHLTRAKTLLALDLPAARQEAAPLLHAAQAFFASIHNKRFLIETLVLQALLHDAEGRLTDALTTLERALLLAQPGGLIRLFLDAGSRVLPLLERLAAQNVAPTFVHKLRIAAGADPSDLHPVAPPRTLLEEGRTAPQQKASSSAGQSGALASALAEPLTAREVDVLAAMGQRLTSREIADALGISAHTVKHHIGNILGKLQVEDRRQAIARAHQLGLLPPAR